MGTAHYNQDNEPAFRSCPRLLQPQHKVYGLLLLTTSSFGVITPGKPHLCIVLVHWILSSLSLPPYLRIVYVWKLFPSPMDKLMRKRMTDK